jgi:hypothetical protein
MLRFQACRVLASMSKQPAAPPISCFLVLPGWRSGAPACTDALRLPMDRPCVGESYEPHRCRVSAARG